MEKRKLMDLVSVGKKTLEDFHLLGIYDVDSLKGKSAQILYKALCEKRGQNIDICCLDVFKAAIEQANNPKLANHKKNWWYWSKLRKKL